MKTNSVLGASEAYILCIIRTRRRSWVALGRYCVAVGRSWVALGCSWSRCNVVTSIRAVPPPRGQQKQADMADDQVLYSANMFDGYMALVLRVVFYIMFGYLLQVLCKNRLDSVAWIVLFLPYVLFDSIMLYAMSMGALATITGR